VSRKRKAKRRLEQSRKRGSVKKRLRIGEQREARVLEAVELAGASSSFAG